MCISSGANIYDYIEVTNMETVRDNTIPLSFFGVVRKSGNSHVVTLPPVAIRVKNIKIGDIIQFNIERCVVTLK